MAFAMYHRLTLIDADRSQALSELALAAGSFLKSEANWLSLGHAVSFEIAGNVPDGLGELIDEHRLPKLDWTLFKSEVGRAKLLISDMDSTIIQNECIDELAIYAGIGKEVAEITEKAMQGDLEFEQALKARVELLGGLSITVFDQIIREKIRVMPGARKLVRVMRKAGAFTALVSGGFTEFTNHIRREIGFDMDQANRLEVRDGVLTGKVLSPILGPDAKTTALVRLMSQRNLKRHQVLAVGDGANDIAMIREAGLGVAFRAHEVVKVLAKASITHNDLTALLYLQGWNDNQIAAVID